MAMTTTFLISAYFLGIAVLSFKRFKGDRETFGGRFGFRVGQTLAEFAIGAAVLWVAITITSALTE